MAQTPGKGVNKPAVVVVAGLSLLSGAMLWYSPRVETGSKEWHKKSGLATQTVLMYQPAIESYFGGLGLRCTASTGLRLYPPTRAGVIGKLIQDNRLVGHYKGHLDRVGAESEPHSLTLTYSLSSSYKKPGWWILICFN